MTTSTGLRDRAAELLPCPFCGGDARFWRNTVDFLPVWDVYCGGCNARVECSTEEKEDAAIDWNTRASPAPAGAEGWGPIETAPDDEWVILGTTGGHVGEAIYGEDEDQPRWRWKGTFDGEPIYLHDNHKPLGWQPLPTALTSLAPSPATPPAEARELVERAETLFEAIKHGDDAHRAWLKAAIDAHFAGKPLPDYVATSTTERLLAAATFALPYLQDHAAERHDDVDYARSADEIARKIVERFADRATPAPALVERAPDDRLFNEVESIIAGLSMLLKAVYSGDDYGQLRIRVQDLLKESRDLLAALPGAATGKDGK